MRKVLLSLLIVLIPTPAFADCSSGVCAVEINCTTGEITYRDAIPSTDISTKLPEPVLPTHSITVQTNSQSWSAAGTPQQITEAVQALQPNPLTIDPCLNGGCTKIEVNATTGFTTILPLSEDELKNRAKSQVEQNLRQAELAKQAYQALPNITAWQPYDSFNYQPLLATLLDETLTPEWWSAWEQSFNSYFESWFWWWTL